VHNLFSKLQFIFQYKCVGCWHSNPIQVVGQWCGIPTYTIDLTYIVAYVVEIQLIIIIVMIIIIIIIIIVIIIIVIVIIII